MDKADQRKFEKLDIEEDPVCTEETVALKVTNASAKSAFAGPLAANSGTEKDAGEREVTVSR